MAKKLDTSTARAKLEHLKEPYWWPVDHGQHIGYRAGAGTWTAKYRDGNRALSAIVY